VLFDERQQLFILIARPHREDSLAAAIAPRARRDGN
jgi:hypothetical protein